MKHKIGISPSGLAFVIVIILMYGSCTEPTIVGTDLLPPEDNIGIEFTDTLTIMNTSVPTDSVRTYSTNTTQQLGSYQLGRMDDPIFGISKADIFAQLRLLTTTPQFNEPTLDSAVLSLTFRQNGIHNGKVSEQQTIKVYQLTESMDATVDYYSNQSFASGQLLGETTQILNTVDTITIAEPSGDTIADFEVFPQVRIPLDPSFGNSILTTSGILENNEDFLDFFKGVHITSGDNDEGMFSYDLSNSGITLYYTNIDSIFDSSDNFERLDTIGHKFQFAISTFSAKMVNFQHDRTGTPVETSIVTPTTDSLIFIQSMAGIDSRIEIPNLSSLGNIVVNKAELVATVVDTNNLSLFTLPDQLLALEQGTENLVLIEDIITSLDQGQSFNFFGGELESVTIDGVNYFQYTMNITGHLQSIVDGLTEDNYIYITTYPKPQVPNRVVIGGGSHSQFPLKLNLTFTKIE